jgi:hypothetical protein
MHGLLAMQKLGLFQDTAFCCGLSHSMKFSELLMEHPFITGIKMP